ncbi:MAG TPA: LPXTG cell wall anchor domain-containing protein [Acidimicrobiales bacterium]|nr:LPXTG cell wall anchor domain-containing protein [Acidimicrobiales bacterium]
MRIGFRLATAAMAATVAGTLVTGAPASATTTGVGSTATKTTVLNVQLGQGGSLLNLSLLGDSGGASIDPTNAPSAATSLVPLTLSSGLLHLNLATPALTTKSPGGASDSSGQALSLTSLGVPALLATGSIKAAALHSDFATGAAHSALTAAEVDNLSVLGGGLLSADLLSSNLGANALATDADGNRGVTVGNVKILDLGALMKGLGIDLRALPVVSVSQLLATLGTSLPALPAGLDLNTFVTQLNNSLTSLRATLNTALTQVVGTVDTTTSGLLGKLGLPVPSLTSTVAQVNAVISQVQAKLIAVLSQGLSALDSVPLVQVGATSIGITTKAADTLNDSSAGITAAPLNVTVAGIALPTLDATALVSTVNGALATANSALNNLLGKVGLPNNLVSLSLLDQAKSLSINNHYTQAAAGITGLTAKIAAIDPAVITAAVTKLVGPSIGSVLGSALAPVSMPATAAMGAVATLLQTAAPLTGGALVQIASVSGASAFTLGASGTVTAGPGAPNSSSLPHTGADPTVAATGAILALLGVGLIAWRRRLVGIATDE